MAMRLHGTPPELKLVGNSVDMDKLIEWLKIPMQSDSFDEDTLSDIEWIKSVLSKEGWRNTNKANPDIDEYLIDSCFEGLLIENWRIFIHMLHDILPNISIFSEAYWWDSFNDENWTSILQFTPKGLWVETDKRHEIELDEYEDE